MTIKVHMWTESLHRKIVRQVADGVLQCAMLENVAAIIPESRTRIYILSATIAATCLATIIVVARFVTLCNGLCNLFCNAIARQVILLVTEHIPVI